MSDKGMKYVHVNTRSIFNKLSQIELLYSDVDVLCCTETWLDNSFSDNMVSLPGKCIFRCDRKNNVIGYNDRPTAGGVCIFLNNVWANHTKCLHDCTAVTQDFEILTLMTTRPDHRFFITICVYKPPKGDLQQCIDFLNGILCRRDIVKKEIWILGDFNTDLLKRDDKRTIALQAFAKKNGLSQCINDITRPNVRGGSCIDLIMSNCSFVCASGIDDDFVSDHFTVFCVRKKKKEKMIVIKETVRDYSKFSKDNFCNLVSNIKWDNFDAELNPVLQWKFIENEVTEILAIMCPYKIVHTRTPRAIWITPEIYKLIRDRKRLLKNYRLSRDPDLFQEIKIARNKVNAAIDKAKEDYIKNMLKANRKDPKNFWRSIKSIIENRNGDVEITSFKDPDSGCEINRENASDFVNDYFANIAARVCTPEDRLPFIPGEKVDSFFYFLPPEIYEVMMFAEDIDVNSSSGIKGISTKICKILLIHIPDKFRSIFANSMFTGLFPLEWAIANVKLLPKSGDLTHPGNWRPISMTNVFSKNLEKLVHKQLLKYLLDNHIINSYQYGFLPGKSTHEAIFKTVQQIYGSINGKKLMGMLLLDVAKAFNCIDHDILYIKMELAGFSENVIKWFRSYLRRSQRVILENKFSDILQVSEGIAQGTVLGPILFIFYINDIFKCTNYVKISLFADDCVMYLSGNNWDLIQAKIQLDFDAVIEWTFRNNLRLNHGKTKALIFGTRNRLSKLENPRPFILGGHDIGFVQYHLYLGTMIDSIMSLGPLLKDIKKKITNKIFMFRKIRKYLTFDAAITVYKQTILPLLDYSGFLLLSCRTEEKNELQKLQNDVLRVCNLSKISDRISIPKLHASCKIISLEQRMRKQLLWLMYILSRDEDFLRVANRVTRSVDKIVFKVPAKISLTYERSPYYVGTKLWDELPKAIQDCGDIYAFKKEIAKMNRIYVKI